MKQPSARVDCGIGIRTPSARSWTFGFLWFSLRFMARIASLGVTDFDRIWSDISRLSAMSSEPDGKSSEVALSRRGVCEPDTSSRKGDVPTASSSWDVPQSRLLKYEVIILKQTRRRGRAARGEGT